MPEDRKVCAFCKHAKKLLVQPNGRSNWIFCSIEESSYPNYVTCPNFSKRLEGKLED